MPKMAEEPLIMLQIRLFESDVKTLRGLFGSTLGVNKAVRTIVRTYIRQVEAKAADDINALQSPEGLRPPEGLWGAEGSAEAEI